MAKLFILREARSRASLPTVEMRKPKRGMFDLEYRVRPELEIRAGAVALRARHWFGSWLL